MNRTFFLLAAMFLMNCNSSPQLNKPTEKKIKASINTLMDNWHKDAANANLDNYIGAMDSASIYIGTDATENWSREAFEAFCKPYFDKKTTWDFTPIERNVYLNQTMQTAWFDELLNTQMGICRGSGTLELRDGQWKIKHYVLSMAIPNDKSSEVIKTKKAFDEDFLKHYDN